MIARYFGKGSLKKGPFLFVLLGRDAVGLGALLARLFVFFFVIKFSADLLNRKLLRNFRFPFF